LALTGRVVARLEKEGEAPPSIKQEPLCPECGDLPIGCIGALADKLSGLRVVKKLPAASGLLFNLVIADEEVNNAISAPNFSSAKYRAVTVVNHEVDELNVLIVSAHSTPPDINAVMRAAAGVSPMEVRAATPIITTKVSLMLRTVNPVIGDGAISGCGNNGVENPVTVSPCDLLPRISPAIAGINMAGRLINKE